MEILFRPRGFKIIIERSLICFNNRTEAPKSLNNNGENDQKQSINPPKFLQSSKNLEHATTIKRERRGILSIFTIQWSSVDLITSISIWMSFLAGLKGRSCGNARHGGLGSTPGRFLPICRLFFFQGPMWLLINNLRLFDMWGVNRYRHYRLKHLQIKNKILQTETRFLSSLESQRCGWISFNDAV